jgi:transcriptional regulator with XRE-family HTH domain
MSRETVVSRNSGATLRAFLVPTIRPTDLARRAGVSPQYVYAVLNGKRPASERLITAAAELGLPVDVIFGVSAKATNDEPGRLLKGQTRPGSPT